MRFPRICSHALLCYWLLVGSLPFWDYGCSHRLHSGQFASITFGSSSSTCLHHFTLSTLVWTFEFARLGGLVPPPPTSRTLGRSNDLLLQLVVLFLRTRVLSPRALIFSCFYLLLRSLTTVLLWFVCTISPNCVYHAVHMLSTTHHLPFMYRVVLVTAAHYVHSDALRTATGRVDFMHLRLLPTTLLAVRLYHVVPDSPLHRACCPLLPPGVTDVIRCDLLHGLWDGPGASTLWLFTLTSYVTVTGPVRCTLLDIVDAVRWFGCWDWWCYVTAVYVCAVQTVTDVTLHTGGLPDGRFGYYGPGWVVVVDVGWRAVDLPRTLVVVACRCRVTFVISRCALHHTFLFLPATACTLRTLVLFSLRLPFTVHLPRYSTLPLRFGRLVAVCGWFCSTAHARYSKVSLLHSLHGTRDVICICAADVEPGGLRAGSWFAGTGSLQLFALVAVIYST
jgi:hypothetical protein